MSTNVLSPLTKGKSKLVFELACDNLILLYKNQYNVDTNKIFENIDKIQLYECEETGYRFFYPFNVDGDGGFYEKLEEISWYYPEWKWDYEESAKEINDYSKVLDIGCGEGKFLYHLQNNKNCECVGLELNAKAKNIAVSNGLDVRQEFVQEHSKLNAEKYDVVTFYQVLEHISDVGSFLKSAVDCTKKGGKIIIAVPNNNPYYLKYDKFHLLNLPPHHMNWWNENSLTTLSKLYNLKLEKIKTQYLENYTDYTKSLLKIKFPNNNFLQKIFFKPFKLWAFINRKNITGASIMAIYTKN